jgi:hypothetical protein
MLNKQSRMYTDSSMKDINLFLLTTEREKIIYKDIQQVPEDGQTEINASLLDCIVPNGFTSQKRTERHGQVVNTPASYLGGAGFKSCPQ